MTRSMMMMMMMMMMICGTETRERTREERCSQNTSSASWLLDSASCNAHQVT